MARRFSFVLPADWWRVPLVNEEARRVNIEHMIDHQFTNIDEMAQVRHELTAELTKQAQQAAQIGGLVMAFYLAIIDKTPVSATMTCYDVSGLMALPEQVDPVRILAHMVGDKELADSLPDLAAAFFPDGVPVLQAEAAGTSDAPAAPEVPEAVPQPETAAELAPDKAPWVKVTDYDIIAYRREKLDPGTDYFGDEMPKVEQLQVTYIQAVPDFGLVQTVFSTPLIPAKDAWIAMWDAIVATFRNDVPDTVKEA